MKILILDDHESVCKSLKNVLLLQGYRDIETCTDPIEGDKEINKNIYDIVILDIMMPKKHGLNILSIDTSRPNFMGHDN